MGPRLRPILVGRERTGYRRYLDVGLAVAAFAVTAAGYALGLFEVSGCLAVLPGHAALVGVLAACWVGYRRDGLVVAWAVAYAALLGYLADRAFLGLSRRSFAERLAYFLSPDGLAVLGVEAVLLGSLAFVAGYLLRWGVEAVRGDAAGFPAE